MKLIAISFLFLFSFFQKSNAQVLEKTTFDLQEYFETQKKDIFKTSLTSPILGNFSFSLEHAFQPRRTLEARFSLVYSNKMTTETVDGFFIGFGYKFFTSTLHSIKKKQATSIFRGFYIQPELLLGFINKNKFTSAFFPPFGVSTIPFEKRKINYQVLLSNFGLQIHLTQSLILDVFGGIGFGFDNAKQNNFFSSENPIVYHQGIFKSNTEFSLAGKAGIRLGIIF